MASFRTAAHLGTRPLPLPEDASLTSVSADINWEDAGAGIAIGNGVKIADIPPGVDVVDWKFLSDDIDSNGTPTVAFTLGTLDTAGTAIATAWTAAGAITSPQTSGVNVPTTTTAQVPFVSSRTAQRTVGLVATAAAATAAFTGKRATLILGLRAGLY